MATCFTHKYTEFVNIAGVRYCPDCYQLEGSAGPSPRASNDPQVMRCKHGKSDQSPCAEKRREFLDVPIAKAGHVSRVPSPGRHATPGLTTTQRRGRW